MQYTPGGPCREDCGVGGTLPHWYTLLTRVWHPTCKCCGKKYGAYKKSCFCSYYITCKRCGKCKFHCKCKNTGRLDTL